jgi:transposase-like protein
MNGFHYRESYLDKQAPQHTTLSNNADKGGYRSVKKGGLRSYRPTVRSWLRPHRGISQEKFPLCLGFFEFVHNVHKRGKALLGALIEYWSHKTLESNMSVN